MKWRMVKMAKRNLMVFEAPIELTERVKRAAKKTYTSTSTICRQALLQYLIKIENEMEMELKNES